MLVGDDTDLLVLLIYHTCLESGNLIFRPEPKKTIKNPRVWNIQAVKHQLGEELCNNILFLHAIRGCNTTSRLHGIGKGNALKKFREGRHFHELAKVFDSPLSRKQDIIDAGENAVIVLYNGKPEMSLDTLRYKRYCNKVASSTCYIQPQTLPPTSAAVKYHSLRVYYQIRQWKRY